VSIVKWFSVRSKH